MRDYYLSRQIKALGPFIGSTHQQNYVWGGAMNLAWNELIQLNGGPLDLTVAQANQQEVFDFNNCAFNTGDLSPDSYYVKAGPGQQTVDTINKERR